MNYLHIFICHYTKLIDRKKHIDEELSNLKFIKIHFVNEYDQESITNEIDKFFFLRSRSEWNKRVNYYVKSNGGGRELKKSEKSLCLKHYSAIKNILINNIDYALIIEDDIIFCDNFLDKLNNILKKIPDDWDLYYPNIYNKEYINNNYIMKRTHPATQGAYSYLINKKCCQQIINEIENNKIVNPIDFEYNWIFYKLNLNIYFENNQLITHPKKFISSIAN